MLAGLRERRDALLAGLRSVPDARVSKPHGGLYLFPEVAHWIESLGLSGDVALAARLRDEAGVKVLPGSAFGAPGYLRLCFAGEVARLELAGQRLKAFFKG